MGSLFAAALPARLTPAEVAPYLAPCPQLCVSDRERAGRPVAQARGVHHGRDERRYRRVCAVFESTRRDTGETFLFIKLDFAVAVTG